ncbi:hypothetical protein ACVRYP_07605 [Streptococcus rifensis]
MARVVYVQRNASNAGCGCLAILLLLGLVFLKSFWRPLLIVILLVVIWNWLKQFFSPENREDDSQGIAPIPPDRSRTIKEADVIEDDQDA